MVDIGEVMLESVEVFVRNLGVGGGGVVSAEREDRRRERRDEVDTIAVSSSILCFTPEV